MDRKSGDRGGDDGPLPHPMRMPEAERDVGYDPEDDGPQWDEGRDLMGEADFADFLSDEDEDEGDE